MAAVPDGASCRRASARFGVSVSSASRWCERFRLEGPVAPKPSGGPHGTSDRGPCQPDPAACAEEPLIFLRELRDRLAEQDVSTSTSVCRASSSVIDRPKKGRYTQLSRSART